MMRFDNLPGFERHLSDLPGDLHEGAVRGLHEALDDWLKRARPVAPKDLGFLRSEMMTEVDIALLDGALLSNSYSQGFNYAHFLHEVGSQRGYQPRTPGTSLTWLADTSDPARSWSIVEDAIEQHLRAKGW